MVYGQFPSSIPFIRLDLHSLLVQPKWAESTSYDTSAVLDGEAEHRLALRQQFKQIVRLRSRPSLEIQKRPSVSYCYDTRALIRPRITIPIRLRVRNTYDANWGKSTMAEKFVTRSARRSNWS